MGQGLRERQSDNAAADAGEAGELLHAVRFAAAPGVTDAGYNLLGQKLGRKGLETRDRILRAALRQLEPCQEAPITLSSVAREASVGMTTLYLYFPDLGSLILAALNQVMDKAGVAFMDRLRTRWANEVLEETCRDFLHAHFSFWRAHARLLHMRNSFADAADMRFIDYRTKASRPLIDLLVMQMDATAPGWDQPRGHLAMVVLIGFERLAAVATNPNYHLAYEPHLQVNETILVDRMIEAEATVLSLTIRHGRGLPQVAAVG